ncbi:MAG: hypothetical protein ACLQVA_18725 [Candidatus Brocadiia bacterium]
MRSRTTRWLLIALMLVLACGSASYAALTEKYCLDGINDMVAVLRFYHRFATDAQYNLDLCRAAKALTQKQLTVERSLLDEAKRKGQTEEAAYFQSRVTRLEHQLGRLAEFKYEETYGKRMSDSYAAITKLEATLAAHVQEYESLFGKKAPPKPLFDEEMAKYRPHRENMAYYLVLD